MRPRTPKDLIGKKWGRLEVMSFVGKTSACTNYYYWRCLCRCGKEVLLRTSQITKEVTRSCGCLAKEVAGNRVRKYGEGRTPLAAIWRAMIDRCHNEKSRAYRFYGAKGVSVCQRWRDDFLSFKADVGDRPPGSQLDRYPNPLGNYEPGNVRWTTCKENQRNRRDNVRATVAGVTRTVAEWSDVYGIKYATIRSRLALGWTDERAVTHPVRRKVRQ